MAMRLFEQFFRSGEPDLKSFRHLLDVVSACENLPLTLVAPRLAKYEDDCIRVSSFSAPFFELLRSRQWFRQFERYHLARAIDTNDVVKPVCVDYGHELKGRVCSFIIPTAHPEYFIVCGPVWLRDPVTLREPFTPGFVEEIAERVLSIDAAEWEKSPDRANSMEPRLSFHRVRRTLQHRAALTLEDIIARIGHIQQTIDCMMGGRVEGPLNADQVEKIMLALCFWARRLDDLGETPKGCTLVGNTGESSDSSGPLFILNRSDKPDAPLSFEVTTCPSSVAPSSLFFRSPVAEKWSFFSDTYRSNKNAYFLERILLIRLWLQDNFAGMSAEKEKGGQKSQELLTELMKRLQRILGADACILYRYAAGETPEGIADPGRPAGYLTRLASFYAPDSGLAKTADLEARNMEEIGLDPNQRKESIAYKALDQKKTFYDSEATAEDMVMASDTVVPQTFLVTPLLSRDCAWGVIEILGCNKYQFPYGSIRWVEELARILMPILFDHWLMFRLNEINRIAMDEINFKLDDKYALVLEHVRKLFMASSARLYLQKLNQTTVFEKKAHAGQPWPDSVDKSFDLEDKKSESVKLIDRKAAWGVGVIGEGSFVQSGAVDATLLSQGHKGCAIIPIYNGRGNCFASVMLTSTDNQFSVPMWDSTVKALSTALNVVLEAIHLQETEVEARQAYFAHTIKTRADRVKQGGARLVAQLKPLLGDASVLGAISQFTNEVEALASAARHGSGRSLSPQSMEVLGALRQTFPAVSSPDAHRMFNLVEMVADLQVNLDEIRKSVVYIAGGPNAEDPREADPASWKGTWADLRLALLQSLKPLSDTSGVRSQIRAPDKSILPVGIKIRLPEPFLVEILNNLVDNARKYDHSPPSSMLKVVADPGRGKYTLEFRNMAPYLSASEARLLNDDTGYRARYARVKNSDGSGIGLRFIRDLARAWGFEFTYDVPTDPDGSQGHTLAWHILRLRFTGSDEQY